MAETENSDDHGGYRVYAIMAGPFTKIGYTRRASLRLADLQTGCPLPMKLVDFWHAQNETHARKVEAFIHALLAEHRASGEWFLCDDAAIKAAATAALAIPATSTWDKFEAAAADLGAGTLARTIEGRRRSSAAATKAAASPERHRELSEALVAWLVGFDPVQRRRETLDERRKREKANKVCNKAARKKGQHRPHEHGPTRKSKKAKRRSAGEWPAAPVVSAGKQRPPRSAR